jgi:hypothetical protein
MLLQTDPTLANATFALVVVTFLLVITAGVSAWLVRNELKLTREQHRTSDIAARPELDADVNLSHATETTAYVNVHYIHGSEPAYDVAVLVKSHDSAFAGEFGTLTPLRPHLEGPIGDVSRDTPWEVVSETEPQLADGDVWLALT